MRWPAPPPVLPADRRRRGAGPGSAVPGAPASTDARLRPRRRAGMTTFPAQLTEFGDEITGLIQGMHGFERTGSVDTTDRRVLILKLADRLHNMQTIRFVPPARQERKSRE